jgi:hypothetical protein
MDWPQLRMSMPGPQLVRPDLRTTIPIRHKQITTNMRGGVNALRAAAHLVRRMLVQRIRIDRLTGMRFD